MQISGKTNQSGQATIEYLIVIPVLLLLFLASLQFVFIYEAKQTLNYATFVGTRAGALNNGNMAAIQDGLTAGLAPLFAHGETQQALKNARTAAKTEMTNKKLVLIRIVNPTATALNGFGPDGEIPNDHLMYRDHDTKHDGMNLQDANLLKVRVTYCVRLIVPLVNRMIYSFGLGSPPTSSAGTSPPELLKAAPAAGNDALCIGDSAYPYRIAVSSEAVVRMQSPFGKDQTTVVWTAPP